MSIRRLTRPADTPPPSSGDYTIILVGGSPALRDRDGNIYPLGGGVAENITGLIHAGANVTLTGSGTLVSPYVVASSGGGGAVAAHKSTHATGGADALTPADIGALAATDVEVNATPNKIVIRDNEGGVGVKLIRFQFSGAFETWVVENAALTEDHELYPPNASGYFAITSRSDGKIETANISDATNNAITNPAKVLKTNEAGGLSLVEINVSDLYVAGKASFTDTDFTLDNDSRNSLAIQLALRPHELAPAEGNAIAAGFLLSVATHANKWNVLDSGGSAIAIEVPNTIPAGHFFPFFRANTGALSFTGTGVVVGADRLADVPVNSAFGLMSRASGVLHFV